MDKSLPGNTGNAGLIPGEGNGNSLLCSCLKNPMHRRHWWATVHGVAKESDTIEQINNNKTPLSMHSMCMITHLGKTFLNMPNFEAV